MSYTFDKEAVSKSAKLRHTSFAEIPDDVSVELASEAYGIVQLDRVPDKIMEMAVKLYTAHLMFTYQNGGISSTSTGENTKVKVGPIETSNSGGTTSFDTKQDDIFYRDYKTLISGGTRRYGAGLVVVK
ncbi:DUF4054 domain-containing protein [Weissella muntiaci]|uniref:DUF4054 domain-containing protein n=1 Tax=Weissella muntiaci TaxID=2508881 RepID=A0A6C2C794_9LACO|nr:DUF4054 domain-containing protein [Weissella muntiaci]TYC49901.1 DUF4054 domain-containing protein [Weissella muntiaci]